MEDVRSASLHAERNRRGVCELECQKSIARLLLPWTMGGELWRHRALIWQFSVREIEGRYRGTVLGLVWSFVTPLAMLATYTVVFGGVFGATWPGLERDGVGRLMAFAVAMFAGSVAFNVFSEPVGRAAGLVVGVPNYVKKVVFPLEILPVVLLVTALFHALVAFALVVAGATWLRGHLPWTIVLLPLAIIPTVLMAMGVTWLTASLGVYLRDVGQAVTVLLQILFFATPVVYSSQSLKQPWMQWLLHVNPLTYCVEIVRDVTVMGVVPSVGYVMVAMASGLVVAQLGYAWFMLTKRGFADVL